MKKSDRKSIRSCLRFYAALGNSPYESVFISLSWTAEHLSINCETRPNIGAVGEIADLVNGNGSFAMLGEKVFDDYWMYYLTRGMAREVELARPPYSNLATYFDYKQIPKEG